MYNLRFQYQYLTGRIFGGEFLILFWIFLSKVKQTIKSILSHHENCDLRYIIIQNNLLYEQKQNLNLKQKWFSMKEILSRSYFLAQNSQEVKPPPLFETISKSFTLPKIQRLFFHGLFLCSGIKLQFFPRLPTL